MARDGTSLLGRTPNDIAVFGDLKADRNAKKVWVLNGILYWVPSPTGMVAFEFMCNVLNLSPDEGDLSQ
jgi:hypothetical protein